MTAMVAFDDATLGNGVPTKNGKIKGYEGDVVIPESISYKGKIFSVTNLDQNIFGYATLSVHLPKTIRHFDEFTFQCCSCLVTVDEANPYFCNIDNAIYTSKKDTLCYFPSYIEGYYRIPDSVKYVSELAFRGSKLSSIFLPKSIVGIGPRAFSFCNLKMINLPDIDKTANSIYDRSIIDTLIIDDGNKRTEFYLNEMWVKTFVKNIVLNRDINRDYNDYMSNDSLKTLTIGSNYNGTNFKYFTGDSLEYICSFIKSPSPIKELNSKIYMNSTLCVPIGTSELYKSTDGWKSFWNIIEGVPSNSNMPTQDLDECTSPNISFSNGCINFTNSTTGSRFVYTIKDSDAKGGISDGELKLEGKLDIEVYSIASGYKSSSVTKASLYWLPTNETNNINNIKARGIIAYGRDGFIYISGLENNELVKIYNLNGQLLDSIYATDGNITYSTNEKILIVKVQDTGIKIGIN